jgi:hypothetical protein
MKRFISKLIDQGSDLAQREPIISLFIGAALVALFVAAYCRSDQRSPENNRSLLWRLYCKFESLVWASILVAIAAATMALLRGYLHQTLSQFQSSHGRVTQANYNAVQTIWGSEQVQRELGVQFYSDEEVVERIESEDLTKPALLRKKTVRQYAPGNPFVSARHQVSLRQNPRRKGSALYGGYETTCRFEWKLKNPADRALQNTLTFPLPAAQSMYDELTAVLNGVDILPGMQIKESALVLTRESKPGEVLDLAIAFKSRGMSTWYFQVAEAREIRDFTLTLSLPDLPRSRLNYPEGCMSPTSVQSAGNGSTLVYRLDHALSNKGMGIALPQLPQPGAATSAVLNEAERGWLLVFAMLLLSFSLWLSKHPVHALLLAATFGAASGFAYGLLADFSDLLFGFWGTAGIVVLPVFCGLAFLLTRIAHGRTGWLLALQVIVFGVVYPLLAGLDPDRQSLYLNICCMTLLAFIAWQLSCRVEEEETVTTTVKPAAA